MNKEDSIKEKFKQALISTVRVISDDYKINNKNQNKSNEKSLQIGELENINDKNEFRKLRAEIISKKIKNEDYSELEEELNTVLIEIGIEEG